MEPEYVKAEGLPPIDELWLARWQDQCLSQAKKLLRRDRYLLPLVFIFTTKDRLRQALVPHLRTMDWGHLDIRDVPDECLTVGILPLVCDGENLLGILEHSAVKAEAKDRFRADTDMLIRLGMDLGKSREEASKTIADKALEAFGISVPDLLAQHIRNVLKQAGAIAYVKIDDARMVEVAAKPGQSISEARDEFPKELKDDPRHAECIVSSMETPGMMRFVTITYGRTGVGRVVGFGEPRISSVRRKDREKLQGRFTWLLEAQ